MKYRVNTTKYIGGQSGIIPKSIIINEVKQEIHFKDKITLGKKNYGILIVPPVIEHGRNAVRCGLGFTGEPSRMVCQGNDVWQPRSHFTIGQPNTQPHASAETGLPGNPRITAFSCFPTIIGFPG